VVSGLLGDTWAFDPVANKWTNLQPKGAVPQRRFGQAMAYDPVGRRAILFGGAYSQRAGQELDTFPNDTWAFYPVGASVLANVRFPTVAPQLLAPADVVGSNPLKTILSWRAVPSAVKYFLETQWQGPTDSTWHEAAALSTAAQTSWTFEFTPEEYRVRWRVTAISAGGVSSAPSDWWTFEPTQ
jgi:hypothetical protein